MSLYEIIQREMFSDGECADKISKKLKAYYDECSQMEQTVINNVFVELIGWSFESLIEMEQKSA